MYTIILYTNQIRFDKAKSLNTLRIQTLGPNTTKFPYHEQVLNEFANPKLCLKYILYIFYCLGQCLNFCCTFVLLPMLRLSVTKLREKGFNYLLPLDKHVSFHAMTGKLIGLYSLIHAIAHFVNIGKIDR